MKNIMISMIVAVYNVSAYLEACMDSMIRQTYKNLEIILVDDGSTDGSAEICDCYEKQDQRIVVIHQKNKGLVRARKTGLQYASGKYVVLIDGDDYIEPVLCEKMLETIMDLDVDFVHADYIENADKRINNIKHSRVFRKNELCLQNRLKLLRRNVFEAVNENNENENWIFSSLWSKIFKADFIKMCYEKIPDNQSLGEDLLCLCHMIMNCNSMALTSDAYYHYNLRDGSLSHVRNLDKIVGFSSLYLHLEQIFKTYNCWDDLSEAVKGYYEYCIWDGMRSLETSTFHVNRYYYGNVAQLRGRRILLYGAGEIGRDYYDQLCRYSDITILGWIDKGYQQRETDYCVVRGLDAIERKCFDFILIAVLNENVKNEIRSDLISLGVEGTRILWEVPVKNCLRDNWKIWLGR